MRTSAQRPPPTAHSRRRRGTIFVTALWVMVILGGVVLVFARSMQVELVAAANRVSAVQAAAIVRGAEQYVLSLTENAAGDPSAVVDMVPNGAMAVGDGYVWLMKPSPDDDPYAVSGVVDEASKVNINAASRDELLKLPGMTNDVADAIVDWRDADSEVTDQGAEDDYYLSLPQPYRAKNGPFETIEELRLVKGMTEEILYGVDLNRDGVLDDRERAIGGTGTAFNAANGAGRGIAPFVTVYSAENAPAAAAAGGAGGGAAGGATGGGAADVNGDANAVRSALQQAFQTAGLQAQRADQIVQQAGRATGGGGAGGGGGQPAARFTSVFDYAARGGMTAAEVKAAYNSLSVSPPAAATPPATGGTGTAAPAARAIVGRLNVNYAPKPALYTLPGLEQSDVEALVSKRAEATAGDVSWMYETLGPQKAAQVGARITNKSYQYAADIVAITADGRSFKRVRVVVDARSSPVKILFRKDLTDLGWPLDEGIRQALRDGQRIETATGTGGSGFGSGL